MALATCMVTKEMYNQWEGVKGMEFHLEALEFKVKTKIIIELRVILMNHYCERIDYYGNKQKELVIINQ